MIKIIIKIPLNKINLSVNVSNVILFEKIISLKFSGLRIKFMKGIIRPIPSISIKLKNKNKKISGKILDIFLSIINNSLFAKLM